MSDTAAGPEAAAPGGFEATFGELQHVVEHLERGELTLEQSLAAYARGTTLLKECYGILDAAEEKLELLQRQANGEGALRPVEPGELGPG